MVINQKNKKRKKEKLNDMAFKFGDGRVFKSLIVMLPAKIDHKAVKTFSDVVDCELPLSLSKNKMKAAKAKIDL